MIHDGDDLSRDESLLGIFFLAASYVFGRLSLRHPSLFSDSFPCGRRWLFWYPFQTIYVSLTTITIPSLNFSVSLGFVTSRYVIMNISIAWTIDKLKIT